MNLIALPRLAEDLNHEFLICSIAAVYYLCRSLYLYMMPRIIFPASSISTDTTNTCRVPPNVRFEIDDVEAEWTYHQYFDFIHCRFMAPAIRDWPRLVRQCFE